MPLLFSSEGFMPREIVNDMARCSKCKQWKFVGEFHKDRDTICRYCKHCAAINTRENREKNRKNSAYRDENGKILKLSRKRLDGKKPVPPNKGKGRKVRDPNRAIWVMERKGRVLYDRMWRTEKGIVEYLEKEIKACKDAIAYGTRNERRKAMKRLEYLETLIPIKCYLYKVANAFQKYIKKESE